MSKDKNHENYNRYNKAVNTVAKNTLLKLLDLYLEQQGQSGITLRQFILDNQHDIVHLHDILFPCCLCPPGTRREFKGQRVLYKHQVETLFNTSQVPSNNNCKRICCSPVNTKLRTKHLDISLLCLLLETFTDTVVIGTLERNAMEYIRRERNEISHPRELAMSDDQFNTSMDNVENAILVLARKVDEVSETRQEMCTLRTAPFTADLSSHMQTSTSSTIQAIGETHKTVNNMFAYMTAHLANRPDDQSSRPDNQSSRPDGQSSRPDGQSSRPADQGSRPDNQSSRPDGQSSRPDGQSSRPADQGSRSDHQSSRVQSSDVPSVETLYDREETNRGATCSCKISITYPDTDEALAIARIREKERMPKEGNQFLIVGISQGCILLKLSFNSREVLSSTDNLKSALNSLLEDVIEAANIDTTQPGEMRLAFTFNGVLTEDEVVVLRSVFTPFDNHGDLLSISMDDVFGGVEEPNKKDDKNKILTTRSLAEESDVDRVQTADEAMTKANQMNLDKEALKMAEEISERYREGCDNIDVEEIFVRLKDDPSDKTLAENQDERSQTDAGDNAKHSSSTTSLEYAKTKEEEGRALVKPTTVPESSIESSSAYLQKLKLIMSTEGPLKAREFIQKNLEQWRNEKITIGIIGRSAIGKSTFINAIRGITDPKDARFAKIGEGNETKCVTKYIHPLNEKMVFYDMPGLSMIFPKSEFEKAVDFTTFDFFLVLFEVLSEDDEWFVSQLKAKSKPFFLVRTRVDVDIYRKHETRDTILQRIRKKILSEINDKKDFEGVKLFLISSHCPELGDLSKLYVELMLNLPSMKAEAIMLALPSVTDTIIQEKVKQLRVRMDRLSTGVAVLAALPVPLLDIPISYAFIKSEVGEYLKVFGLDKTSNFYEHKYLKKKYEHFDIGSFVKKKFLTATNVLEIASLSTSFVLPIGGSIWSGLKTKSLVHGILESIVKEFKQDAITMYNQHQ